MLKTYTEHQKKLYNFALQREVEDNKTEQILREQWFTFMFKDWEAICFSEFYCSNCYFYTGSKWTTQQAN